MTAINGTSNVEDFVSFEDDANEIPDLNLNIKPSSSEIDELREKVIDADDHVRKTARDMLRHAMLGGQHLRIIKDTLDHGQFMPFVRDYLPFSQRKGNLYMSLAYRAALMEGKLATDANLNWEDMSLSQADAKLRELHDDAIDKSESLADAIDRWSAPSLSAQELDFVRPELEEQKILALISNMQALLSRKKARAAEESVQARVFGHDTEVSVANK